MISDHNRALIETVIESQNALSAIWLATKLNTSLWVAQQSIDTYARSNKVEKKIIVSGFCNDTGYLNFSLVTEKHSHSMQLQDINFHTYSIGKDGIRDMNQIVQTSDDKLVYDCLNAENGLPFLNSLGGIKLRNLEVRNVGDRVLNDPIADLTAVRGEAVQHIDAVFAAKPTTARKAKSSIDVTNFFSKADSLKKLGEAASTTTAVECSDRGNSIMGLADPDTKTDSKQVDDGEEAEWEEPEEVPVKKGKTAAKREHKSTKHPEPMSPRPRLDSKKEEQLPEELRDQGQGRDISSSPPPAKQQRARKRKEVLHGAMDDFMNEKDPDLAEQGAAAAPSEKQPKSKKRRLVEKVDKHSHRIDLIFDGVVLQMFADSKGYLVTEMVWEEFSDEGGDGDGDREAEDEAEAEAEVPPPSKSQPSLAATQAGAAAVAADRTNPSARDPSSAAQAPQKEKKPAAGAAKKAPKSNPAKGGTQKSMMSFFGAKP